ncbi:NAD(P)H-quinone oxidoreductase subunit I, chloroplastic [uncultured archaeon]|nr:NAD(P)H-quinone oxidoreductase subunit I, chloroplastic [uncultured archaeon]
MNKVEIYYFSGTGNSLHVARELQKRIPGTKLIPIVSLLDKEIIKINGETIGLVFPIHLTAIPMPVKNFIKKLDLTSAGYIFAIATRIGTPHSAFMDIEKILNRKSKNLDSCFSLNMPGNDPKFNYNAPTKKEIAKLESAVQSRLDFIQNVIIKKEKNKEKDTSIITPMPSILVRFLSSIVVLTEGIQPKYYADSKCTGCGTCEKVCLSKKIKIINKRPVWRKDIRCYRCDACLNYCPVQAVQIKNHTEKNGRYSHPYATAGDIAGQK